MYALLFTFLLFFSPSDPYPAKDNFDLTIQFEGYAEVKGQVLYKIVDEKDSVITQKVLPIAKRKESIRVQLPQGKYAVSAFHDINSNFKLDKNLLGVPTEKYGFSNNVRGTFGPPPLEAQLVELKGPKTIKITLK